MTRDSVVTQLKSEILKILSDILDDEAYIEQIEEDPYYIYHDDEVHGLDEAYARKEKEIRELNSKLEKLINTVKDFQIYPEKDKKTILKEEFTEYELSLVKQLID